MQVLDGVTDSVQFGRFVRDAAWRNHPDGHGVSMRQVEYRQTDSVGQSLSERCQVHRREALNGVEW